MTIYYLMMIVKMKICDLLVLLELRILSGKCVKWWILESNLKGKDVYGSNKRKVEVNVRNTIGNKSEMLKTSEEDLGKIRHHEK